MENNTVARICSKKTQREKDDSLMEDNTTIAPLPRGFKVTKIIREQLNFLKEKPMSITRISEHRVMARIKQKGDGRDVIFQSS